MPPGSSRYRPVRSCVGASFLLLCAVGCPAVLCGCATDSSGDPVLTYTLLKQPFAITIEAEGVLEAKVAQTLVAPRLREIKRLEMQRDELRAEKIRKRLTSSAAIQKEEQAHQKIRIKQAERKLKQAQEALDKLVVKAPTDGIVVHVQSRGGCGTRYHAGRLCAGPFGAGSMRWYLRRNRGRGFCRFGSE